MTEPGDGSFIADKGWPARKLYLSPEAIALMEAHCKGTPLTMSAYVDMLIKRDAAIPTRPGGPSSQPKADVRSFVLPTPDAGSDAPSNPLNPDNVRKQPTKKDFDLDV